MKRKSNTLISVCPFARFGNSGTQAGAELIADAVREMLDDNEFEKRAQRAKAYQPHVRIEELALATDADYAHWRERARKRAASSFQKGEFLFWIGGNHLSVLPIYEELAERERSLVIQFDAHLDIYHHSDCGTELTHGNFIKQLKPHRPEIVNLGHRDQFLKPEIVAKHFRAAHTSEAVFIRSAELHEEMLARIDAADLVFIDIDWDVLDPAYFPAVVDGVPFGLNPLAMLVMVKAFCSEKLAGIALSEFDPGRDDRDRCLQVAVWFIEEILLKLYER